MHHSEDAPPRLAGAAGPLGRGRRAPLGWHRTIGFADAAAAQAAYRRARAPEGTRTREEQRHGGPAGFGRRGWRFHGRRPAQPGQHRTGAPEPFHGRPVSWVAVSLIMAAFLI